MTKEILSKELRLKISGNYFLDQAHRAYHPISVVIYNDKSMLGYFDPLFRELGFHERLMHASTKQLHNVIRHEIAHYILFINDEYQDQPHGPEFRAFCQRMGWGEEVYRATLCLEDEQLVSKEEESDVLRKVQKLMALAGSSNKNEAEQAMIKSQQLLLKHNIESKYIGHNDEEKMFLKRIIKQKQRDAKMRSISKILDTFFVSSVFNRSGDFTYLEILGTAVNVQIAEYVADVLQQKLDVLWLETKQEHQLKGVVAKNSFFLGLAKGYCDKIGFLQKSYQQDATYALVIIGQKLEEAKAMVYSGLSSMKSHGSYCPEASQLGELAGKHLNINPGLNQTSKNSEAFLTHKS
ncbi:MAG: DUF2786 domain-containing protein [Chlamydiota bacterium]